jgi:hypothetical protein
VVRHQEPLGLSGDSFHLASTYSMAGLRAPYVLLLDLHSVHGTGKYAHQFIVVRVTVAHIGAHGSHGSHGFTPKKTYSPSRNLRNPRTPVWQTSLSSCGSMIHLPSPQFSTLRVSTRSPTLALGNMRRKASAMWRSASWVTVLTTLASSGTSMMTSS